jgi:hypothetical protein
MLGVAGSSAASVCDRLMACRGQFLGRGCDRLAIDVAENEAAPARLRGLFVLADQWARPHEGPEQRLRLQ